MDGTIATQRLAWLFLISRELGQMLQAATLAIHGDALNHGEAESRADGHEIEKGLLAPLKKIYNSNRFMRNQIIFNLIRFI